MKEINMTKAISCMPDKFITMEMVELAAAEHRPELVNYLPEKYIWYRLAALKMKPILLKRYL